MLRKKCYVNISRNVVFKRFIKKKDFTEQIAHSTLHNKYLKTRGAIRGHEIEP